MLNYLARRILYTLLTLTGSLTLTFSLVRLLPGEPFHLSDKTTQKFIAEQNRLHGLDLSLPAQLWDFFSRAVRFDFGESFFLKGQKVSNLIWSHFTISMILIGIAFGLMLLIGVLGGFLTGRKQNTWLDHVLSNLAVFFSSLPSFLLAALAFALSNWLITSFMMYEAPIGGWGNPARNIPPNPLQIMIPALIIAIRPAAMLMRMTYTQVVEVKDEDYVRTAYAKGLGLPVINRGHIYRNSLIPVASSIGNLFATLLIGVSEVEIVFNIPGLGNYFVRSILNLDYPVVVGATCFYTFLITGMGLLIDMAYLVLDPRITFNRKVRA